MDDSNRGLYGKYEIRKADTGELVTKPTFTLCPETDPAARAALRAYATHTDNPELALDLMRWLGGIQARLDEQPDLDPARLESEGE